jgi:CheY-like chemotaxis protein
VKHALQLVCGSNPPDRQAAPATGEGTASDHWRSLRLVVADDDKDTVNTLAAILEDEGHRVRAVYEASEVMSAVRRFEPDAVILDIAMPGMSGYDIVKSIRTQFITYRPVVIAISGVYRKPMDVLLSQAVGFDHHLTKPVHPDEILNLLAPLTKSPGSR